MKKRLVKFFPNKKLTRIGNAPWFLLCIWLVIIGVFGCRPSITGPSIPTLTSTDLLRPTPAKPVGTSTTLPLSISIGNSFPTTQFPTITPSKTTAPIKPTETKIPQPIIIGYSAGNQPLEVYHFGDGPHNRMIIAGIHGGYEWNTIALADQLIEHLNQNPDLVPEDIRLYVLRSANPDGEKRDQGPAGRANDNGVDLNRNFPANWQKVWDRLGCWNYLPISAGAFPASEPETSAIMKFILSYQIKALISYHSAALGIFAGGVNTHPKSDSLAQALSAVSNYSYPPKGSAGCEYTGQLSDWAANQSIAAVDIELTNHKETDFTINLKILSAFLKWDDRSLFGE
jgi:predicted deacylase